MKRGEAAPAPGLAEAVLFQRDLYLCWRLARAAGGLPLTTRGQVVRPVLRRLRAELAPTTVSLAIDPDERDDLRLFFLRRLLERLGLLRRGADDRVDPPRARLLAADEREMARYLAYPLAERLRICARVWMAGGWWPDTPGAGELPAPLTPAAPRIAIARRQLIETLLALAPGDPISAPMAGPRPRAISHPLRAHQRRGAPAPRNSRASAAARIAPEDETQRAALLGPLTWMGFVMVAGDDPADGTRLVGLPLAALRRQPASQALNARAVEDDEAAALLEHPGRVVAQADLTLIAYPPLTAPALHMLDSCAERDALDQTARYRLTRSALAAAHRTHHWQAADVAAQLEALTGAALPANVRVTLDDWERHVERLRLTRDARLLTVADAALLDALLADRGAAAWVERRLTPTVALLTPDGPSHVRRWLLKRGHLPAGVQYDTQA